MFISLSLLVYVYNMSKTENSNCIQELNCDITFHVTDITCK